MEIIVKHQALELNWLTLNQIAEPKTLVLGSFNPYQNLGNSVDYYYGRISNHFWKTIARLNTQNEAYFFTGDEKLNRKIEVMNNRFCCMDVINSIKFTSSDSVQLNKFLDKKIYSNFLDQTIWTSKTKFEEKEISIHRTYNQDILTIIRNSATITKVIHTMGDNRINACSISPGEKSLGQSGFSGFMNKIIQNCKEKNIEFVYMSYSPSDYAVKTGKTKREELENFYKKHLGL